MNIWGRGWGREIPVGGVGGARENLQQLASLGEGGGMEEALSVGFPTWLYIIHV